MHPVVGHTPLLYQVLLGINVKRINVKRAVRLANNRVLPKKTALTSTREVRLLTYR